MIKNERETFYFEESPYISNMCVRRQTSFTVDNIC